MPLSRYQIRNEYSLADPELYRAADKDDPEALLEGVAMAGLVGVLRQLGDLAEFAAEVFHDLHEEVIATAARGHSLMVRVQQLEAEFPSIETAFLSQTNHSSFFYNAGIDWHPNMHMDQNLITQGDMPRFIMDSYEECRGPPRLFLLDKFDVAGAGACLKRYTDPSFFKVETSAFEITNADVQRDKRTRKGKKKGSRWRNGETPEILPAPHAKLHELLLEERIENTISDPARRVKLKRRLNGFPFDSRTGESYMERFLKIPSPEHKVVHEISVYSSPLKLPANSTCESGLDVCDINSESPDKKFRYGSPSLTPDMEETVQKLSTDKLNGNYESPKANLSFKEDDILSTFPEEVGEKEISVDGETKTGGSIGGYQSDDVASEVDNYVDALATMESEIDTDSELRSKSHLLRILSNKRQISGFDASEAPHQQASFSDSQSMESSMLSEDGNSMFKKEISNSSYSDTHSITAENTYLEGDVPTEGFLFNDMYKGNARSPKQERVNEDMELAPSTENANDDGGAEVAEIPTYMSNHKDHTMSSLTILQPTSVQMDAESTLREHVMLEGEAEEMLYAQNGPETELINNTGSEANLNIFIPSDAPQMKDDSSPRVFPGIRANDDSDDRYLNVGDSLPCDLSDITNQARDASSLADSAKSLHLDDLRNEENLSSLSSSNQPPDESGGNNSNMSEHSSNWSPEDLPSNRLDQEDPSVISGASDDDQDILSDASVRLRNTISIASEDEKSKISLGKIPQTENSEDYYMENQVDNLITLPISIAPYAEEQSLQCSLPELETHDTIMESDNKFSAPDDVILPAGEQPVGQSFPEHDSHDTAKKSDLIDSEPDDVTPPAAGEAVNSSPAMESPKDVHSEGLQDSGVTDDIQPLATAVDLTKDQIDLPIPLISHLDEKSLESSVKESIKDAHSTDLQISGTTDNVQPPDPAVNLIEDQINSRIPAISYLDDESRDFTPSEVETSSKGAEPDDVIPDVNNMISPAGEIAGDIIPIMGNPNLSDLRKLQASAILEDHPQLDSEEAGISCNIEENHVLLISEHGVEADGPSHSTDLVERDAADLVIPSDFKSLPSNVNLTDADAKRDDADAVSRAGFDENANDSGVSSFVTLKKLDEESLSKFEESKLNEMEAEVSVEDSDSESDVPKELGTPKVISQGFGSDLSETFHHDDNELEALGNVPNSYSQVQSSLNLSNAIATSSPLQQSGLGTIAILSQNSDLIEYTEDISSLPTHHNTEQQKGKLSRSELDNVDAKVLQNAPESNLESLQQLEQEGSLYHLDQEGHTNTASVALLENRRSQPSVSKLLPDDNGNIGDTGQPKDLFSSSTAFGLLPEAKIKLEEMPPLPPLPPVQWRMGKLQNTSSIQEKEALPSIVGAFPSLSPSMADQKAQTSKPFLPRHDIASGNSNPACEYTSHDPMTEGTYLSQFPLMVHENKTNKLPPLSETQSMNQLLPLPEKLDKIPEDDSHVGEKEKGQPRLVTFSEGISLDMASTYASKLPGDETSRVQHQIAPETSLKDEKLDQGLAHSDGNILTHEEPSTLTHEEPSEHQHQEAPDTSSKDEKLDQGSAHFDGNIVTYDEPSQPQYQVAPETNPKDEKLDQGSAHSNGKITTCEGDVLPSKIENEQPQKVMSSPMGEIAWSAQDDGKENKGRTTKLPRPRNPLIDAVVAHDKSKLRKVTQHPRPQLHKADERDSLLEQIRAKSFNLKPTVVSRPSIQGPTTNLKVAAILEKAKTIRQAFAGSDEDDDDDSWSDS